MRTLPLILAFLLILNRANGQELRRWKLGAHLVRLDLDSIGEGPGGAGGRISYFVNNFVAVEAEANRFFEDPSHNFGHTELLAGARYGYRIGPLGIYAKTRPGLVRLGGATAALNPGRENHFALDIGGVITLGQGRAGMRIDTGDAIIFWAHSRFHFRYRVPSQITIANSAWGSSYDSER